jgi:3-dehydroquinate dehydratase type I
MGVYRPPTNQVKAMSLHHTPPSSGSLPREPAFCPCYSPHMDWIVTLTPCSAGADPIAALAKPPARASVVELRLDLFPDLEPALAVSACPLPILATLRSTAEGGVGPVDPVQRGQLLTRAREAGAALIDVEMARDRDLPRTLGLPPEQTVLSWHDPSATPADLDSIAASMLESPARWVKIVPTAHSLRDLERTLSLLVSSSRNRRVRGRLIAMAMGTVGQASRYLAPLLGAPLGYAAWEPQAPAAPGQPGIDQLDAVIGHLDRPPQRIYGVVGKNVSASLSPRLHSEGYRAHGLPYLFVPLSVPANEELELLFTPQDAGLFAGIGLNACGWAVTSPYKTEAARAATRRAPRVVRARAANTLALKPGLVIADNTGADGVVGAAVGLDLAGASVFLRGRNPETTRSTAEEIGVGCYADGATQHPAILVNATPLGSDATDPSPFSTDEINAADAAVDMVYAEHDTCLCEIARDVGTIAVNGLDVLAHQGVAQFAAFTGKLLEKRAARKCLDRG